MRANFKRPIVIGLVVLILAVALIWLIVRSRGSNVPTQGWQVQQTKEYKVSYPRGWIVETKPIIGDAGFNTTLFPDTAADEKPVISIQGTSTATSSLDRIKGVLAGFKYQSMPININGIAATKFSGTIPPPGITVPGPIRREVAIVFQRQNTNYLIKLSYLSDKVDPALEQTFMGIVSNIKFN